MKTLLVPVSFERGSRAALNIAVAMARPHNARIILVHVLSPVADHASEPVSASVRTGLEDLLVNLLSFVRGHTGLQLGYLVREGVVADEIIRAADESCADLVVLANDRFAGAKSRPPGNVTARVMAGVSCAAATVMSGENVFYPMRKISYLSNCRDAELATLKVITRIAKQTNAELSILHVTDDGGGRYSSVIELAGFERAARITTGYAHISTELLGRKNNPYPLTRYLESRRTDLLIVSPEYVYEPGFEPGLSEYVYPRHGDPSTPVLMLATHHVRSMAKDVG